MAEMLSDYLANNKELFKTNTLVGLFRLAASRYPNKDAAVMNHVHISFKTMDHYSDALAHFLTDIENISRKDVIAVYTDRSVEAIIMMLGVLKTGASFVYLDPACPGPHNDSCIERCRIKLCIDYNYFIHAIERYDACSEYTDRSNRRDPAVYIFTSGSTGTPKGVRLLHYNLMASASHFIDIGIRSDDHFCTFSGMTFVAYVYDMLMCFAVGCTMYIMPGAIRKHIAEVAQYYIENDITVTFLPPHMVMKYIEVDENSPLRLLLCGSESTRNLKPRHYDIVNVYASSEACGIACHYTIKDARKTYPIGKPVSDLRVYVVDEDGHPVKAGETGELWLSGPQMCDGYVDLPEVNKEHFLANPFENDPQYSRVFKSADMVSLLPDGNLEYVGRKDTMYKIRGFRVEAECVERHILEFPDIKKVCVTCFEDNGGTKILFAYFIADIKIDHEALRGYLAQLIPKYAIPVGLVQVEEFPRLPNGKVDRHGFETPRELNNWKKLAEIYR